MKILYAIQGTGNGHLSRALDIVPCLQKHGEVDVLVSGIQADLDLPFPVKYRLHGLSFIFGKKGGIDIWKTFVKSRARRLIAEISSLPVADYDMVISDFEPVSAWACNVRDKECIGLSHQMAALHPGAPKPKEPDALGRFIMKNYAPPTMAYGFHFQAYGPNVFTPVIRKEIRALEVRDEGHYTVYLPAFDDAVLLKNLSRFKDVRWQIFSKHNKKALESDNMVIQPISNAEFIQSMASASGVLCGAGFETPAEALYMQKKLMVVPMKNQYEQHLNADALAAMGVPVVKNLKPARDAEIRAWLDHGQVVPVDYPDRTQEIIDQIFQKKGGI